MTDTRFVVPAPGRRVRVPSLGYVVLPEAGDHVPDDTFLRRRLAAGDVVDAEPPEATLPDTPEPDGDGASTAD